MFRQEREDPCLGRAAHEGVLDLEIADGVDRLRPTDGVRSHLRQPDGADVPGFDEIRNRADGVLDGHTWIEAARTIDVNVVQAEARQTVREKILHRDGPGIQAEPAPIRAAQRPELHRDQRLVATIAQRPSDQQLVVPGGVVVAGVEQGDPGVKRRVNRRDALGLVRRTVEVGHPHAAQGQRKDDGAARPELTALWWSGAHDLKVDRLVSFGK